MELYDGDGDRLRGTADRNLLYGSRPDDRWTDGGRGQGLSRPPALRAYPFTAPKVSPDAMKRRRA